jgi:hypothetical protein
MTQLDQALPSGFSPSVHGPEFGPPLPPATSGTPRRPTRWIALALVLFVGGPLVRWMTMSGGPSHPSRWNPRVADLAAFVETERGLRFDHPVSVDFLSDARFRREVTSDEGDLSADERKDIGESESTARAVGLVRGDADLFAATNTLNGDGILALYDPDTQRVKVRGTELTARRRATLVHELTHALQDQHFDLSRQGTYDTDAQNSALEAVVEGDAMRVEHAYVATFSDDEKAEYHREGPVDGGETTTSGDVPDWLSAFSGAPYILGEPFVAALVADGGLRAVDRALRNPPASEEQLMDAAHFLEGDDPLPVHSPKLAKGDRLIDRADFGTFSWLVMLSERIPARDALVAVDGWGGDAYVAFERQGKVCVRAAFTGDRRRDTDEMAAALDAWALAMPPGAASVSRRGHPGAEGASAVVEVFSCDPGPAAEPAGAGHTPEVMILLANRASVFAGVLGHGASSVNASCLAQGVVGAFAADELSAEKLPPDFEDRMAPLRDRCFASRSQPVQS